MDGAPYHDEIKRTDRRFPNWGLNLFNYDDAYQIQDPARYREDRPDKLFFANRYAENDLSVLVDFRAQALHDHPDALGVTTLICDDVAWLVETVYEPRAYNRQRWLHNVPLYLPVITDGKGLKNYRTDTWREPLMGDVRFLSVEGGELVVSRLRHDAFDYVAFDEKAFEVERIFVHLPGRVFAVIDRITLLRPGGATVGQIWHTPSEVESCGSQFALHRHGRDFSLTLASNRKGGGISCMKREIPDLPEADHFYFDGPVHDILQWSPLTKEQEVVVFAASFSRCPESLMVSPHPEGTSIECAINSNGEGVHGDG